MNILTYFSEFNSYTKPDFLYVTQFWEREVKFTKYEKKNKQKRKRQNISAVWKIEKLNNFHNINSQ